MYQFIYALSFKETLIYIIIFFSMWCCIKKSLTKCTAYQKLWELFCYIGMLLWLFAALKATVLFRSPRELAPIWTPFMQIYSLTHGGNPEILRTVWMNIILFVPLGMILPELLPYKWRTRSRAAFTVFVGALASTGIELAQWRLSLGQAETDDVIANTLGTLLGFGIFLLGDKILSNKKERL